MPLQSAFNTVVDRYTQCVRTLILEKMKVCYYYINKFRS